MATGSVDFTKVELFAVLNLRSTTEVIDFVAADIPDVNATAMAEAYLDMLLARGADFEPLGRKLRRFANVQLPIIKAAIAAL